MSREPSIYRAVLIGVDGGGTKTRVSVCDLATGAYGTGLAGPGNYHNVGVDAVRDNIGLAWKEACDNAGLACNRADSAFIGLGSVVSEDDRSRIHKIGLELGLASEQHIGVDHDLRIAAAGAFPETEGVVLVAGTGSAAYGVTQNGNSWRSGGWGPTIDDAGSAYWLGVEALRAVVKAHDGRGPATRLTAEVMSYFDTDEHNRLMFLIDGQSGTRCRIAGLGGRVTSLAGQGDAVATDIVRRGTIELAQCVAAVQANLSLSADPLRVALVGGMARAGDNFLVPLRAALSEQLPGSRLVPSSLPPADGAILLAAKQLGAQAWNEALRLLRQNNAGTKSPAPRPHTQFSGSATASTELSE